MKVWKQWGRGTWIYLGALGLIGLLLLISYARVLSTPKALSEGRLFAKLLVTAIEQRESDKGERPANLQVLFFEGYLPTHNPYDVCPLPESALEKGKKRKPFKYFPDAEEGKPLIKSPYPVEGYWVEGYSAKVTLLLSENITKR